MTEQQEKPISGAAFTSVNISPNQPNHHLAVILDASVQTAGATAGPKTRVNWKL